MSAESVADLERTIAEVQAFGEALKRQREEATQRREAAAKEMRARFAALGERALERLRQLAKHAPAKHERARARRRLERYGQQTTTPKVPTNGATRPSGDVVIEFTPDAVAYIARKMGKDSGAGR
jgi:hypothetical protein